MQISVVVAWIIIVALFAILVPSIVRMSRRSTAIQKHAAQIMTGRSPLTHEQFGVQFFASAQATIATKLREMLAKSLIVDARRIHPDDRLIEDLGFGQMDGLDGNVLEFDVEREFGVSLRPGWPDFRTVRDLVTYVSTRYRAEQ